MNKCTDTRIQETLPDLLHGTLDERARQQVEMHLAGCESCRDEIDVIRRVKGAAVFAPSIDADRVARQIPPYRMIVPGVGQPARTRIVTWLVAAGLALAVVGGGSVLLSNRETQTRVAAVDSGPAIVARPIPPVERPSIPSGSSTTTGASAPAPRALALASDIDNLSDGSLVQLMNDMDGFEALPAAEPDPVISVDSGDSL